MKAYSPGRAPFVELRSVYRAKIRGRGDGGRLIP